MASCRAKPCFLAPCRELQLRVCAVPLHRRLLEGLLRHCLANRWLQAEGVEQGERQM